MTHRPVLWQVKSSKMKDLALDKVKYLVGKGLSYSYA